MSKKHYIAIAECLKAQYDRNYGLVDSQQFILHLSWLLASRLQDYNGQFNPQTFVNAATKGHK